ncbi:MAG: aminotransferase class V-fold PLP-dependent enzyme, partial [Kiritimatiellae bacterium]|nr:aminotransferase class V-fold PLP-dependent enzyme [Kiritimatiellia bacterium]
TGVLYVREKYLEQMPPFLGGGDMISSVSLEKETWAEPPYKFEAGTPDVAGIIGLGAAVDFMQPLDWNDRMAHERALTAELETGLKKIKGLRILADGHDHHGLVSFTLEGVHPHDVAHFADQAGVSLRAGYLCAQPLIQRLGWNAVCRASLSVYNDSDDLSALIEALSNAARFFNGC